MSLTPRSRLISDSARSPPVAVTATAAPTSKPCHHWPPSSSHTVNAPPIIAATTEPEKPSQDFFGEIDGAIGCLPNSTPAAYPPVSEATTMIRKVMIRAEPSDGASIRVAKLANNPRQTATKMEAEASVRYPAEPR